MFLILLCFGLIDSTTIKDLRPGGYGDYDWRVWGNEDTIPIVWNGAVNGTLYIAPQIRVGDYSTFAVELFGDVDSLKLEYRTAATLEDFLLKSWDWNIDTICTGTDSVYKNAPSYIPFDVFTDWRLIDLKGYNRTLWFRFKEKK